ncbi:MAG: hypothetical protein LBI61_02440 [Puniceicoccales bacterium]|nr:hypothetical protein [Puniceicoccales bacterium]
MSRANMGVGNNASQQANATEGTSARGIGGTKGIKSVPTQRNLVADVKKNGASTSVEQRSGGVGPKNSPNRSVTGNASAGSKTNAVVKSTARAKSYLNSSQQLVAGSGILSRSSSSSNFDSIPRIETPDTADSRAIGESEADTGKIHDKGEQKLAWNELLKDVASKEKARKQERKDLEKQEKEFEKELETTNENLALKEVELKTAQKKLQRMESDFVEKNILQGRWLSRRHTRVQPDDGELERLRKEVKNLKKEVKETKKYITKTKTEIKELKEKKTKLESELREISSKLKELREENKSMAKGLREAVSSEQTTVPYVSIGSDKRKDLVKALTIADEKQDTDENLIMAFKSEEAAAGGEGVGRFANGLPKEVKTFLKKLTTEDKSRSWQFKVNKEGLLVSEPPGFQARIAYDKETGKTYAHIIGTRGSSSGAGWTETLKSDAQIAIAPDIPPDMFQQGIKLAEIMKECFGENECVLSGHSLGGGIAQLACAYTGINTLALNPAPINRKWIESSGLNAESVGKNRDRCLQVSVKGEILTDGVGMKAAALFSGFKTFEFSSHKVMLDAVAVPSKSSKLVETGKACVSAFLSMVSTNLSMVSAVPVADATVLMRQLSFLEKHYASAMYEAALQAEKELGFGDADTDAERADAPNGTAQARSGNKLSVRDFISFLWQGGDEDDDIGPL